MVEYNVNTNDLRVIKTKNLLHETLIKLLKNKTFNEITVVEICKLANINRSTFYAHYMNIDELFLDYFTHLMAELKEDYLLVLENLDNPKNQSMNPLFNHIIKHRNFYDVLLSKNAPIKHLIEFKRYIVELPYEVIVRNLNKDTDLDLFMAFSSGATMSMIYHWRETGYQKSAEEMTRYLTKFFSKDY